MSPAESKLYSMFIGPKGENLDLLSNLLIYGLQRHKNWRQSYSADDPSLYPERESFQADESELRQAVDALMQRLEMNLPYFHPRYAAQMLKDPAIPAVLGYVLTMLTNPNNHAYEGGPATTELELEVISDLLRLVGFESGWGHLSSGGSLANLEALWAVRDLRKDGKVLFSVASHLSWKRICAILRIPDYAELAVDSAFRLDLNRLEDALRDGAAMMVVANFGTTGCGAVDPLEDIVRLRDQYGFHLHVDAAYGGYVKALLYDEEYRLLSPEQMSSPMSEYVYRQALALAQADSVTIDPHKHGMMPYGAGSILYRHEDLRQAILHSAPYTYHVTDKPNIGTYTLEGSRPGAAAAGCWLTHRLFPLHRSGVGAVLAGAMKSANKAFKAVRTLPRFRPLSKPDLDIFCFYQSAEAKDGLRLSQLNPLNERVYKKLSIENPQAEFIFSKLMIDPLTAKVMLPSVVIDDDYFLTLRAVFIKHWLSVAKGDFYFGAFLKALKSI